MAGESTFFVPGRDQPYTWMFNSCNGFSSDVTEEVIKSLNNIQPLWTDVHREHKAKPFHLMVGGGDQLYSDDIWRIDAVKPWLENPDKDFKAKHPWTEEMNAQAHRYYFNNYLKHFQEPGFKEAMASIPYIFTWDDHDICDGYGSYPDYLRCSAVMQNIFVAAQRFYLLFQHHTNLNHARADGYIGEHGHSFVSQAGPSMAILMVDVRTERTLKQVVTQRSWDMIWDRLERIPTSTRHLVFPATIPLAYPRLNVESAIQFAGTAAVAVAGALDAVAGLFGAGDDPKTTKKEKAGMVNWLQQSEVYTNLVNQLGEPELLDDMNDHWDCPAHLAERDAAIHKLQSLAERRRDLRVTFISGDVHCCGAGKFYSASKELQAAPEKDHRLMYQIISSAMGNIPPPGVVISALHKQAKELPLDELTRENMYPIFDTDLEGKELEQKYLLAARNWTKVTVPENDHSAMLFQIRVEKKSGDIEGLTKPYQLLVPGLKM
ncbi:hypothetical protein BC828DRAFT_374212 [Blastocladiella britannica]|nr:hypothetical protein BC828DRAFT_374212 [Blastocladiella britannica]